MARKTDRIIVPPIPPGAPPPDPPPAEILPADGHGFDESHPLMLYQQDSDLAHLEDVRFNDWTWKVWRLRTADEMIRERTKVARTWVVALTGPLDVADLQRAAGGGLFELWGYYAGALRARLRIEIEGPRRVYDQAAAAPPPASALAPTITPANDRDMRLMRALRRQQRQIDQLTASLQRPPAAAPTAPPPSMGVDQILDLADRLASRRAPAFDGGVLQEMVGSFKLGMEAARDSAPAEPKSTTEIVIDKLLPLAERLAASIVARGPAPRRAPPVAGPAAAPVMPAAPLAEVVDPAAPAAPAADGSSTRWSVAVEALAEAIEIGDDPAAFADALERMLPQRDVDMLRVLEADTVLEQLRAAAAGRFQVLATPAAELFVRQVHAELRREPDEGDGEGGGEDS